MILELKKVYLTRSFPVLSDVSLSFDKGKIYGVIGRSGAGKTSLLKLISGFLDATSGELFFKDTRLMGPSIKLIPGYDDIQLVNQDFGLDPYHSVEENIREKILSRHKTDQLALIEEFLELVELGHLRTQKASALSGGEQQRLALARALACEPEVLLLDEPFVHLDQRLRWKVLKFLRELNKKLETTIVIVSHDGSEMMGFAEEIIHIEQGSVRRIASADDMFYHPISKEEAELMGEINTVSINGQEILFRPNEYEVELEEGVSVKFDSAVNTGLIYFNYFHTADNQEIMLSSSEPMNEVNLITIKKRA